MRQNTMRLIAALIGACAVSSALAQQAGKLDFVQGSATVVAGDGTRRQAQSGSALAVGESVETGDDGEVHVLLADGGMIAVRAGSGIRIDAFRAQGDAADVSRVRLLKGALRALTGWLAKINPRSVSYRSATATVGVRGTDFDLLHATGTGDAGASHVRVRDGEIALSNDGGEQIVGVGQAAQAPFGGTGPRLHDRIPEFMLRSEGRNEARVAEHGRNIARFMETSLRERRMLGEGEGLGAGLERRRNDIEREQGNRRGEPGAESQRGADAKGDGKAGDTPRADGVRGDGVRGERIERPERPQRPERPDRPDRPRRPNF